MVISLLRPLLCRKNAGQRTILFLAKRQLTGIEKYAGNDTMIEYAAQNRYEIDLYSKFNQYYGYVFYIGRTK